MGSRNFPRDIEAYWGEKDSAKCRGDKNLLGNGKALLKAMHFPMKPLYRYDKVKHLTYAYF